MRKMPKTRQLSENLPTYPQATFFHCGHKGHSGYWTVECRDLCFEYRYLEGGERCVAVEYLRKDGGVTPKVEHHGKRSRLVIAEGWKLPPFNEYTARFLYYKEDWDAAYDQYVQALRSRGVIIADFRDTELMDRGLRERKLPLTKPLDVSKIISAEEPTDVREELLIEGAVTQIAVNRYERDPKARRACIEHFGLSCQICHTNFAQAYPGIGEGFIHVHHLVPLSSIGRSYQVDPIRDLVPVCPNCHAMLHRRDPPYSPDEVRGIFRREVQTPSEAFAENEDNGFSRQRRG